MSFQQSLFPAADKRDTQHNGHRATITRVRDSMELADDGEEHGMQDHTVEGCHAGVGSQLLNRMQLCPHPNPSHTACLRDRWFTIAHDSASRS